MPKVADSGAMGLNKIPKYQILVLSQNMTLDWEK
jgi:hypothetical protein